MITASVVMSVVIAIAIVAVAGLRIIPQTCRGLVETFGKYTRFANTGLNIIIPGIESVRIVNITEKMVEAEKQEIITEDNLNAQVDAQVYFKIKSDEQSLRNSQYNVYDVNKQIVALARTTLRNIIGTLTLKECNSERNRINDQLRKTLAEETQSWGIDIVRAELKEIDPPADVQETMNKIVKAQNEKVAAIDFATARETEADGIRRAEIKKAEGERQARILRAEGEAAAIALVNEAAEKYFIGNAQVLKKLECVEKAMSQNSKIVIPAGSPLTTVIGNLAGC